MIAAERAEVIRLRDENDIGDEVLRRIQQDLDLEEVLLTGPEEETGPTRDRGKRSGGRRRGNTRAIATRK
jgi:hypothetical protein